MRNAPDWEMHRLIAGGPVEKADRADQCNPPGLILFVQAAGKLMAPDLTAIAQAVQVVSESIVMRRGPRIQRVGNPHVAVDGSLKSALADSPDHRTRPAADRSQHLEDDPVKGTLKSRTLLPTVVAVLMAGCRALSESRSSKQGRRKFVGTVAGKRHAQVGCLNRHRLLFRFQILCHLLRFRFRRTCHLPFHIPRK